MPRRGLDASGGGYLDQEETRKLLLPLLLGENIAGGGRGAGPRLTFGPGERAGRVDLRPRRGQRAGKNRYRPRPRDVLPAAPECGRRNRPASSLAGRIATPPRFRTGSCRRCP